MNPTFSASYLTIQTFAIFLAISVAGVTLIALALLGSALDLVTGLHLAFIWFRAPYDSFYIRVYRLLIGFIAAVTCKASVCQSFTTHNLHSSVESFGKKIKSFCFKCVDIIIRKAALY